MVPIFEEFLYPFLLSLKDGKKTLFEVKSFLKEYFNLSELDCSTLTQGGKTTQFQDRINWCRQYFRRALFITIPTRGTYELTDRGRDYIMAHSSLTISDLMEYKEYAEYRNSNKKNATTQTQHDIVEKTPTETLEDAFKTINDSLKEDLIATIMEKEPSFFEKLVVDLLVAMGYGGTFKNAAMVTQYCKDGGIDGIIKEDKLGLDNIYVQAKRWTPQVSKPHVQQFAGALDEKKASKGVFITTSTFSKDARLYVENLSKKIVLIDGEQLADYMIEYNVGVCEKRSYIVKRIDLDYFNEE